MYQSVGSIFGLNEVYGEQAKNAKNDNFASWPENASYGYWSGGGGLSSFDVYSQISLLDYSSGTSSSLSASLPANRKAHGGMSDRQYGYFAGGNDATLFYSNISRLDFSNNTVSNPGKVLSANTHHVKGVSSFDYGYFAGGYNPVSSSLSTINRMEFSNETVSSPGKNLIGDRNILMGPLYTKSFGYFCGGYSDILSTNYTNISRLDYFNETVSNPGTNLPSIRNNSGAVSGKNFGYFYGGESGAGGGFGVLMSTVTRFDFSTESCNNLPNLTSRYSQGEGGSDFNYAYMTARLATSDGVTGGLSNSTERIDYTTEVRSAGERLAGSARCNTASVSGISQQKL